MTMIPVLDLGGDRWLGANGQVFDRPMGDPVLLDDDNRAAWEAAAQRGGHDLAALLQQEEDSERSA